MSFIVTPNIIDRSDKLNRWLVRPENTPLKQAEKHWQLKLSDVHVRRASSAEMTYGCSYVTVADKVVSYEAEPLLPLPKDAVKLRVNESGVRDTVVTESGFYTKYADLKYLFLLSDGSVYGVV